MCVSMCVKMEIMPSYGGDMALLSANLFSNAFRTNLFENYRNHYDFNSFSYELTNKFHCEEGTSHRAFLLCVK